METSEKSGCLFGSITLLIGSIIFWGLVIWLVPMVLNFFN